MKKYLLSCTLILSAFFVAAQPGNDPASKLKGKWLLVKHTLTEKGKTDDLLTSNEVYTYDFAANGTYEVSYTNKKNESTTVYKGKWKILNAGKKLRLYDNTLPSDPGRLVADKNLPIIKLTSDEFVTKELLFGMDLLGTSYYKKQ